MPLSRETCSVWLLKRDLAFIHFGYMMKPKGSSAVPTLANYPLTGGGLSQFSDHLCVTQGEATGAGYNRVQRGPPPRAVANLRDPSYSHFPEVCVLLNTAYS